MRLNSIMGMINGSHDYGSSCVLERFGHVIHPGLQDAFCAILAPPAKFRPIFNHFRASLSHFHPIDSKRHKRSKALRLALAMIGRETKCGVPAASIFIASTPFGKPSQ
jgi:hypothetical protein